MLLMEPGVIFLIIAALILFGMGAAIIKFTPDVGENLIPEPKIDRCGAEADGLTCDRAPHPVGTRHADSRTGREYPLTWA